MLPLFVFKFFAQYKWYQIALGVSFVLSIMTYKQKKKKTTENQIPFWDLSVIN